MLVLLTFLVMPALEQPRNLGPWKSVLAGKVLSKENWYILDYHVEMRLPLETKYSILFQYYIMQNVCPTIATNEGELISGLTKLFIVSLLCSEYFTGVCILHPDYWSNLPATKVKKGFFVATLYTPLQLSNLYPFPASNLQQSLSNWLWKVTPW